MLVQASQGQSGSAHVVVLGNEKGSENEAMMRARDCGAMRKQLRSWRVFYTLPARTAELLKQDVQVGKKGAQSPQKARVYVTD